MLLLVLLILLCYLSLCGACRRGGVRVRGGRRLRGGARRVLRPKQTQGPKTPQTRSKITKKKKKKKKKKNEFIWDDVSKPYHEFPFTGNPGVNANIYDQTCLLSILKTFLSDNLIEGIVKHTNTYA